MKKILIIITFMIVFIFLISIFSMNIINGQSVKIQNEKKDISSENQYDLLIITPKNFLGYIEPLIQHKNNYDIKKVPTTRKTP